MSSVLPRPVATAIIAGLLGCAAAAWLVAVQQAAAMVGENSSR